MTHYRSFTMHEVRLIGWKKATSLGYLSAFSNGFMITTLQIRGQSASWNEALNMESSSWRAKGTSDLRDVGGMLSGPGASLHFIFWILDKSSNMLMEVQLLLSTGGVLRHF